MAQGKPILRVGKIKATGTSTLQSVTGHLNRTSPTPNADPARRKLNRVLVGDKSQTLVEAVEVVYQKFGIDRAALRKDATLANDIVLTVSPEWFRPDDPDAAGTWDHNRLGSFTAEAEAFLRKGFGNRLVRVDLHLDEATPHIHAVVVPILPKKDRTGFRLSSKDMFNPKSLTAMQENWERVMSQHGVGQRLKGSKATHTKLRDYYSAVASQEVHMHLENLAVNAPPERRSFEGAASHREKLKQWQKTEQKRLRDELRPLKNLAAKGRLYDAERLSAQAARSDATASRESTYRIVAQFTETIQELDLAKAEIDRLRHIPTKTVAAALGYEGPIGTKENAIDLVKRVGEIDFKAATAWLHQNLGEEAMAAALRAKAASQTPAEPVWTKADRVKRRTIETQLGALDAEGYRITLMRDGTGINFGSQELGKDVLSVSEVTSAVPILTRWNHRGWHVYVTPIDHVTRHILIDDLTDERLTELKAQGYTPALVQRSSPQSIQAVLKAPLNLTPEAATNEFYKDLNRARGDQRIVGMVHPFRLAGFQNRKEKHQDGDGRYPFVTIVEAVNVTCRKTIEMVRTYVAKIATPERVHRPKP